MPPVDNPFDPPAVRIVDEDGHAYCSALPPFMGPYDAVWCTRDPGHDGDHEVDQDVIARLLDEGYRVEPAVEDADA